MVSRRTRTIAVPNALLFLLPIESPEWLVERPEDTARKTLREGPTHVHNEPPTCPQDLRDSICAPPSSAEKSCPCDEPEYSDGGDDGGEHTNSCMLMRAGGGARARAPPPPMLPRAAARASPASNLGAAGL